MPTFGRRPAGSDIGTGEIGAGWVRAAIMGRINAHGWAYLLGARVGKGGTTNATYYQALYNVAGSTITTPVGASPAAIAATVMDYGGAGANQTIKPSAPLKVSAGRDYALAIRCSGGSLVHGQDHSGHIMHDRAASSFPSPLNATNIRPEGKPSFWAEIQNNRPPARPSGLSPANGAYITLTPTLAADFRDPDEVLPGFSLGQADTVSSYQFEVWNSAKTTRLRDSGRLGANASQKSSRRVTWLPSTLPAGSYIARCTVWDDFGTPSPVAEWRFSINAGGATVTTLNPAHVVGALNGEPVTNRDGSAEAQLSITGSWSHSGGLGAKRVAIQIKNQAGSVIRGPLEVTTNLASGAAMSLSIGGPLFTSWPAIPRGARYTAEIRYQDSADLWSPWGPSERFIINAAPNIPNFRAPYNTAVSEPPELTAEATDSTDSEESLTVEFAVRAKGASDDGKVIPSERRYRADDRWWASASAVEFPIYAIYEWRVRAIDPWGLVGDWSSWLELTYAEPPIVTITTPADGSTITTGTPMISATSSRPLTTALYSVRDAATSELVYQARHNASGTSSSDQVPVGRLRNNHDYRITVDLTSTEGLTGTATVTVTLSYPAPPPLATLRAQHYPGAFEGTAVGVRNWSRIGLLWTIPPVGGLPPDERFGGFLVRRTSLATNETELLAHLKGSSELFYLDRTPLSGEAYRYDVTYIQIENNLDLVESFPVSTQSSVTLINTVITSMDDDDLHVPLFGWQQRNAKWITDIEVVPSWEAEPIGFQGSRDSDEIAGTWQVVDDPHGIFTARDLVAATRRMAGARRNAEGKLIPRVLCYRDPLRRRAYVLLMQGGESDRHYRGYGEMPLSFTEVADPTGVEDPV